MEKRDEHTRADHEARTANHSAHRTTRPARGGSASSGHHAASRGVSSIMTRCYIGNRSIVNHSNPTSGAGSCRSASDLRDRRGQAGRPERMDELVHHRTRTSERPRELSRLTADAPSDIRTVTNRTHSRSLRGGLMRKGGHHGQAPEVGCLAQMLVLRQDADRVAKIVAGSGVWICNECVDLCVDIIAAETNPPAGGRRGGDLQRPSCLGGPYGHDACRTSPRLVLASGSASRLRVLRDAGFDPMVLVSGVDEDFDGLNPTEAVVAIAERKALAVADRCHDSLVIGCDSMLELDGEALRKPASGGDEKEIWRRLSGRQATLNTGHCLIDTSTGQRRSRLVSSVVHFGSPSDRELAAYAATEEPLALAGAFSIEGLSGPFVKAVHGSPSNVLGLSLPDLREMLLEVGVEVTDLWRKVDCKSANRLRSASSTR